MRHGEFAIDSSFDEITERLAFRHNSLNKILASDCGCIAPKRSDLRPANVSTVTVRLSSSIDQ
jgi:hypothetical protein